MWSNMTAVLVRYISDKTNCLNQTHERWRPHKKRASNSDSQQFNYAAEVIIDSHLYRLPLVAQEHQQATNSQTEIFKGTQPAEKEVNRVNGFLRGGNGS